MKQWFAASLCLLVFLVGAVLAADDPDPKLVKEELAKLKGTWKIVFAVRDGVESDRLGNLSTVTFDGSNYTWSSGKRPGTIMKLDPTKKPKTVDYQVTEGVDKGKTDLAIFEIEGDTLKDCFAPAGAERPKEFVSMPGSGHTLIIYKRVKSAPPEPAFQEPSPQELNSIWNDFAVLDDGGVKKSYREVRRLIQFPRSAVPFLGERLRPVAGVNAERVDRALLDLDDNDFNTREKASQAIEKIGPLVLPILDKKLREPALSLEVRKRLTLLTAKLEQQEGTGLSADELRGVRAIEVLQGIGTPEAIAVLEKLAGGAEGARLTIDAKTALAFLAKRVPGP